MLLQIYVTGWVNVGVSDTGAGIARLGRAKIAVVDEEANLILRRGLEPKTPVEVSLRQPLDEEGSAVRRRISVLVKNGNVADWIEVDCTQGTSNEVSPNCACFNAVVILKYQY